MSIPVYLFTGFLDAGKTAFIQETLEDPGFNTGEKTLVLLCEEGENEYRPERFAGGNVSFLPVEEQAGLTTAFLKDYQKKHRVDRVLIEYNGMWPLQALYDALPTDWDIYQIILLADSTTFASYMTNMRQLAVDKLQDPEMVIFNRCKTNDPLTGYRRGIKVVNPSCDISFEDEDGELIDLFEENTPYDMEAPVIEIEDVDYGIFYVDMDDHPDKYVGKTVKFKARAMKSKNKEAPYFVPGRKAMTCCADDMQMIGYICKSPVAPQLKHGQWVMVTAKVAFEYDKFYRGKGPVLYAGKVEPCEPPADEMVYFN